MKHTWYECPPEAHDDGSDAYCMFCAGGLSACTVCGGFEGTLTTHCLGNELDKFTLDKVWTTNLDYVNGAWVHTTKFGELVGRMSKDELRTFNDWMNNYATSMQKERVHRGW